MTFPVSRDRKVVYDSLFYKRSETRIVANSKLVISFLARETGNTAQVRNNLCTRGKYSQCTFMLPGRTVLAVYSTAEHIVNDHFVCLELDRFVPDLFVFGVSRKNHLENVR